MYCSKDTKGYNKRFNKVSNYIYRLKVPFDELYTSVFLVEDENNFILVDCATTPLDVDEYIVPALVEFLPSIESLKNVVITHKHADHSGGTEKLSDWKEYIKKIDYSAPYTLKETGAVDKLFIFDNTNDVMVKNSLQYVLEKLGE